MPGKRYRLLWELAKGLHKTQAKTLTALCGGLVGCGQLRSFAVAGAVARATGVRFKSALKRFYRWVHNPALDELACWSALAGRVLPQAGRRPLVAVDWTEWHSGLRVLSAAVCVGSRAVPVLAQAFSKTEIPRSQNTRENTLVHMLVRLSVHLRRAVLIFDRGFRRISLIRELGWLSQPFIIRMAAKVQVASEQYTGLLSAHPLRPGQRADLGVCALGQAKPVRVRVIGVWAPSQEQPWWLATTLNCSARRVAAYYDRRMGIEEHFRDSKGCRYGIQLKWTAFTDPAALARLFLLAAIASAVWLLAGVIATRADPSLRLDCRCKGPRRSLIAVGIDSPQAAATVLALSWARLSTLWPKAKLRDFAW